MFGFKRLDQTFELISTSDYIPAETLASISGVTSRTVRTDISKINAILEEHGGHIGIKRDAGYYLEISDQTLFDVFKTQLAHERRSEPDLSSADERIRFLLRSLLGANDFISYDELGASIYVSENTIANYVRQIKDLLEQYDLALLVRAGIGVKVLGREEDIRRCYMDNLVIRNMQGYVRGFTKEEEQLFPNIDLPLLEKTMHEQLSNSDIFTSDYDFKNLLVHIALMIERTREGCAIETNDNLVMTPRIKLFIDNTCNKLEKIFSISINEAERSYFYLHLLANTSLRGPDFNDHLFKTDVDQLLEYVFEAYGFDLRTDAALKNNLLEHLNATFRSKELKVIKKNPLLNTIRKNYPLPFEIALASTMHIFDTEPYTLSEDEIGYVALHMGAAIERVAPANHAKLKAALVCGAGKSIEQMIQSRLKTLFGDKVEIVITCSYAHFQNLGSEELSELAMVITTVPFESCSVPNVLIDLGLNPQDTSAISRLVNELERQNTSEVAEFFEDSLFMRFDSSVTKMEVLGSLCDKLEQADAVQSGFLNSVLEREAISDTSMTSSFAIPHSMNVMGHKTKVAVAISQKPIEWNVDSSEVQIIFLLAIRPGDRSNIEHLYDLLLEITNNKSMRHEIISATSFDQFMTAIMPKE